MFTRRELVRNATLGSAGLALLPFTQRMQSHAAGDVAKLPKRFVFLTTANGIAPGYLFPEVKPDRKGDFIKPAAGKVDRITDQRLADVGLASWAKSLEPFIERTTMVTGLSGKMCSGQHSTGYGALGAIRSSAKPSAETIDGALCKVFQGVFPHVGLSANGHPGGSASTAGVRLPLYKDALELYNIMFGVISDDPMARRRNRLKGRLMDYMAEDVKRFRSRLAGEEKAKLDYYLTAFENMGKQQRELLLRKEELQKFNFKKPSSMDETPEWSQKEGLTGWESRCVEMADLASQVMIAGLTNVVTYNLDGYTANAGSKGADGGYGKGCGFEQVKGGHGFGHGPTKSRVHPFGYCVQMMTRIAATLDKVPEGDGTMLDNTLMLIVSSNGDAHHTRCGNFPMVLMGNCGRKMRMGRHIQYPGHGKEGNCTIGNMYTTLLHAAGIPRDGFGQLDVATPEHVQKRPLAELMAS